jgi:hypothetical protein
LAPTLPLGPPSLQRILDPFLDHIKITAADPADYLGQDLLGMILDPSGEVATPSMVTEPMARESVALL